MKKIALLLLTVATLSVTLPQTTKTAYAYNNKSTLMTALPVQSKTPDIINTLNDYFANKWEESKNSKIIENNQIAPNSEQKTYDDLKSKLERKWCEEINESIDWYDMDLTINKVRQVDDLLEVDKNVTLFIF